MIVYQQHIEQLQRVSKKLSVSDKRMSVSRLFALLAAGFLYYQYNQTDRMLLLIASLVTVLAFLILIRKHRSIRRENDLTKVKIQINQDELGFISEGKLPFENGAEFIQSDHHFSYDLDFFGDHSLFQTLNRTGTIHGKNVLANHLTHILPEKEILENQRAIQELTADVSWRQHVLGLGRLKPDSKKQVSDLTLWAEQKAYSIQPILRILSFLLPAATLLCLGIYVVNSADLFGKIGGLLFLFNLGMLGIHSARIKEELTPTTKIEDILRQYALLLKEIEHKDFQNEKLQRLKSKLVTNHTKASEAIHQLSLLFGRLEHVTNVFASPILNGLLQYHVHVLHGLNNWRNVHADQLKSWLYVIGEIESINSLSNFAYNHPEYVYPTLNQHKHIQFENLGHPLIPRTKSVTNSIDFGSQRFFILTGSNMSGKSTFLRTIGVNMVLAGIGAPIYASKATIHPMPVFVSMRLSDSLTDSESYFYAEVKRLKYIMEQLESGNCFVLLDEILRGTNSDDKRNGTMEVIRKMAKKHAYGGIATHDLEVCRITDEFPDTLTNKRFEVEIVNDELVFDYTLRDGICENKSASFIMKKMGVI